MFIFQFYWYQQIVLSLKNESEHVLSSVFTLQNFRYFLPPKLCKNYIDDTQFNENFLLVLEIFSLFVSTVNDVELFEHSMHYRILLRKQISPHMTLSWTKYYQTFPKYVFIKKKKNIRKTDFTLKTKNTKTCSGHWKTKHVRPHKISYVYLIVCWCRRLSMFPQLLSWASHH